MEKEITLEESYKIWREVHGKPSDPQYDMATHKWHYENGRYHYKSEYEKLKKTLDKLKNRFGIDLK